MITIEYCAEGIPVSDFNYKEWFENEVLNHISEEREIKVSTSIPIQYVRLMVITKIISNEDVQFKFQDQIISMNKYSRLSNWPKGFCDISCDMAENNIREGIKIRKLERESKNV